MLTAPSGLLTCVADHIDWQLFFLKKTSIGSYLLDSDAFVMVFALFLTFLRRGNCSLKGMEIINGAVLPRYAAPAAGGALSSDARVSGHLQLLRRVRLRGRACGLQAHRDSTPRRFFGSPSPRRHGISDWGDWPVHCSYGSSSDGDGAAAANFDASGEDFVDSTVIEAGNCLCFPSIPFLRCGA
jgi:hypothetical protein